MSKFQRALSYVLDNEGGDSNQKFDRGGRTRFGITEAVAKRHGANIETLTRYEAGVIYRRCYWRFDGIGDEAVAIKVFDFAVNAGLVQATRTLQQAANDLGSCLEVDGVIGPKTLLAVNMLRPWAVIRQFAHRQSEFYKRLVEKDPTQAVFAKGWQARADRVPLTEEV